MGVTTWWRQRAVLREYRGRHPGGLDWRAAPAAPQRKHDAHGARIGSRLYVAGGYESLDVVQAHVDVYDLAARAWVARIPSPPGLPESHVALATDGSRHLWIVSGQKGPRCSPCVRDAFSLDVETRRWSPLPALPEPRYAATMQHWRGRLHVFGGAREDRYTPAADHWSLGSGESAWREEPAVPTPGMHRASAVLGDRLYAFGGQQGDFVPVPGDPACRCDPSKPEVYLPHVYAFDGAAWERLHDLPLAVSHVESAIVVDGSRALLLGGQVGKRADTHEVELTDRVQEFDAAAGTWSVRGHLPYRVKTCVAALLDGVLFFTCGQRDQGADRPVAGEISSASWTARI